MSSANQIIDALNHQQSDMGDRDQLHRQLIQEPAAFLSKHGKEIPIEFLSHFDSSDDPAVWRERTKLIREHRKKTQLQGPTTRNRRYAKMLELIQEGVYFSMEQMKSRDPLLYHQYIGRYSDELDRMPRKLSEQLLFLQDQDAIDEKRKREAENEFVELNPHLSQRVRTSIKQKQDFNLDQISNDEVARKAKELMAQDESKESDESELSSSDESEQEDPSQMPWNHVLNRMEPQHRRRFEGQEVFTTEEAEISQHERELLEAEFTRLMQISFLEGRDEGTDYELIDQDTRLDQTKELQQDAEDSYFDGVDDGDAEKDFDASHLRKEDQKEEELGSDLDFVDY
eukprot:TRINITY_DN11169_c0_g1_i1.p1 TRINITY_DN11169_c0_g1~~TRINITY_DN11169_c0_g1_i1.p1  ORF type:complete len:342 (+),score=106.77 TRINITY_DN11169_c0_g1_i1:50-1075(+)